ncbi:S1 family peptidase [Streptomyces sp. NPDC056672]|uniref:S1 family peptidase n=1 Tax=Streptomyces sp. NPDC056672 TaxID=3345906 RepID=UPI00367E959C
MTSVRPRTAATAVLLAAVAAAGALVAAPAHAVSGDAAPAGGYAFTARLAIGADETARACTGSLVDAQWILTAASCFATDPETATAAAGKPALRTTATVSGKTGEIVELVPRAGRDVVLARLARPATGITPVALSATAVTAGEQLKAAGFGRTSTEWVPDAVHTAAFTVDTAGADDIAVTGVNAALCKGDTGGPLLRETNGTAQLVGVNSRSWQGGCFGEKETRTGAVAARTDDLAAWVTATVTTARPTDFNCDGVEDIAVGDPKATVGGDANAGLVRIVYGGGKGTFEVTQDLGTVPGGSEAGDGFGSDLAVFDHNEDGCADLVVGVPADDIGTEADAGMASVLYGARGGLTTGAAPLELVQGSGTASMLASASEAGDRMGDSLAAGQTAAGEPYLLIGVPNEDLDGFANAGMAFYLRGTTNVSVHQDKPGVSGGIEANDRFGASVAGSPNHIAIGAPGEAIGELAGAGMTHVFQHKLSADGIPTPFPHISQDTDGFSGSAEADDRFGESLSMIAYRPSGAAAATDSIVAVGSPGEALQVGTSANDDAGRVVIVRVTAAGAITQFGDIHQDIDGVSGDPEPNDHFGAQVAAVNTAPGAVGTAATLRLAVGLPGEDLGTATDAGAVQTFPLLGAPGDADFWIEAGNTSGLPGALGASQLVGNHLNATGTHLYIGMPNGPSAYGAVHALPWSNTTSGTSGTATTYQPGQNGLPAAGKAFGTAIR